MRFPGRRTLSFYFKPVILVVMGLVLTGAAIGLTSLTVPKTVIVPQRAVTTSACGGTLTLTGGPTPGTGILRFNCPPSSGAFTITQVGADTPAFNPPTEITSVGYVSHAAVDCTGFTTLTSGSATTLVATGDLDVCAAYSCPTGCTLGAWSISWSN